MQQPIATNDVILFSTLRENQYFDRKSARKDDKEIAKHISAFANSARRTSFSFWTSMPRPTTLLLA